MNNFDLAVVKNFVSGQPYEHTIIDIFILTGKKSLVKRAYSLDHRPRQEPARPGQRVDFFNIIPVSTVKLPAANRSERDHTKLSTKNPPAGEYHFSAHNSCLGIFACKIIQCLKPAWGYLGIVVKKHDPRPVGFTKRQIGTA